MTTAPTPSRPAFTLIETVVALVITAIILAAVASMFAMSLKAFPRPESDPGAVAAELQDAASRLRDDLSTAIATASASGADVTLKLPDRDRDGQPESVRWSWSGTPGDTLKVTLNASAPLSVGPPLASCVFSPWWQNISTATTSGSALEAQRTLLSYPGGGSTNANLASNVFALTVIPVLDADATSFQPVQASFYFTTTTLTTATVRTRIYLCDLANLSGQTAVATSSSVSLNVLGVATKVDLPFIGAPEIAAGTPVTFVVDAAVVLGRVNIHYSTSGIPLANFHVGVGANATSLTEYTAGGGSFELIGRQRRPVAGSAAAVRLQGVGVVLTPSARGALPIRFAAASPGGPTQ